MLPARRRLVQLCLAETTTTRQIRSQITRKLVSDLRYLLRMRRLPFRSKPTRLRTPSPTPQVQYHRTPTALWLLRLMSQLLFESEHPLLRLLRPPELVLLVPVPASLRVLNLLSVAIPPNLSPCHQIILSLQQEAVPPFLNLARRRSRPEPSPMALPQAMFTVSSLISSLLWRMNYPFALVNSSDSFMSTMMAG